MKEQKKIPRKGLDKNQVLEMLKLFREKDIDWKGGRTWSLVYYAGEEHLELLKKAHAMYFSENGLNPMAFRSLKRMESEIVSMTASMLNGGANATGALTSGGTESLLLAVKTYRDLARSRKPRIRNPELVAPRSIHAAVDKACHYFNVKPRYAALKDDFRADPKAIRKLVGRNTILVMASAPQYPQGVVDPVSEIAEIARRKKIPLHVDACFGGFVLPWLEKAGYEIPAWDFRVEGVTSISADLHKYGYAAKGVSSIIYRNMDYMKHQFFVSTDWPGGIYASASMPGTRPGGPVSAAWAALMSMGEDGYTDLSVKAMKTAEKLREGVEKIRGLCPAGKADAPVVAWMSEDEAVDVFVVADQMAERGWEVGRQQNPDCVHMTVNANQASVADQYLSDLADAVDFARNNPEAGRKGDAAMYGMMASVPFRGLVRQSVLEVMQRMYSPGVYDVPELNSEEGDKGLIMKIADRYGHHMVNVFRKAEKLKKKISVF